MARRSHQHGDDRAFHSAAEAIIEDERRKRHDLLADDLAAILEDPAARRRPLQVSSLTPLPKTRDEHPLLGIVQPSVSFQDLVLPPPVSEVLESIVDEFRLRSQLRAHGVQPRSTLLFVGPPGCGKSMSAPAIAGELGLPVARIQLAVVVSSYLGERARNLEQIFRLLETGSWVLLFDEFDLLGRERADRSDHGELRRVVAAMLQIIDEHHADSLFIATSNHPALLDTAVWRRFDDVVEFDLPDKATRAALIRLKLRGHCRAHGLWDGTGRGPATSQQQFPGMTEGGVRPGLRLLRLAQAVPANRRRQPDGFSRPRRHDDLADHGQQLQERARAITVEHLARPAVLGVDPRLVLVIELNAPVDPDEFRRAGLQILDGSSSQVVVAFADDPALAAFQERLDELQAGPRPGARTEPHAQFFDAIDTLRTLEPADHLTAPLRTVLEAADPATTLRLDVECWHPTTAPWHNSGSMT